jgi:hypothetical protein
MCRRGEIRSCPTSGGGFGIELNPTPTSTTTPTTSGGGFGIELNPTPTPTFTPQGILPADISISPVFGFGEDNRPAQMGQLGIHTGDGNNRYPRTIDVVPEYAEACIDASMEEKNDACQTYLDAPISVYAPPCFCQ